MVNSLVYTQARLVSVCIYMYPCLAVEARPVVALALQLLDGCYIVSLGSHSGSQPQAAGVMMPGTVL